MDLNQLYVMFLTNNIYMRYNTVIIREMKEGTNSRQEFSWTGPIFGIPVEYYPHDALKQAFQAYVQ